MSAVAAKLSRVGSKFQMVTAACVIAAAAMITPAAVAHAGPAEPAPTAGLGSQAGACDRDGSLGCPAKAPSSSPALKRLPTFTASPGGPSISAASPAGPSITAASPPGLFQNPFLWFGAPNPNAPEFTTVFTFTPLTLLPGFIRPLFSWFEDINYSACVAGFTLHVGPYGTVSGGYSRHC
jgi:hypothetical protein